MDKPSTQMKVALNIHEPFCLVTMGVQGAGKSHTVATVVESCLVPAKPLVHLRTPMSALVFHYDDMVANPCECVSLMLPAKKIEAHFKSTGQESPILPTVRRLIVLTSPCYYQQRKQMYNGVANTEVRPLLFRWSDLQATQLKKLMAVNEGDNQLYMNTFLSELRKYQRDGRKPSYDTFKKEIMSKLEGQSSALNPLKQRFALMDALVAESADNRKHGVEAAVHVKDLVEPGTMIIADLTDPLMDPDAANSIFDVLLEQYRGVDVSHGKLCVFDEAHKYLTTASTPLSNSIVSTVRQIRHYGMRVVVSTQSPMVLPPELLELSSVAVCHRFHSRDWYRYLSSKIPLPSDRFDDVRELQPGEALVCASRHGLSSAFSADKDKDEEREDVQVDDAAGDAFMVQIRPRMTRDGGASRTNKPK